MPVTVSLWYTYDVTPAQLEAQVQQLQAENVALRQTVSDLQRRQADTAATRRGVVRWGARMLIPLLDRQKVARSFGALVVTASRFGGARDGWPSSDQVVSDARTFAESCVRFAVRRRTLLTLFSLVAASIPLIQVWLVIRQNEIIENQTQFAEIQVYDMVARSMTEGDRNARLVTGALLSRGDLTFLQDVIDEAFDVDLVLVRGESSVGATQRRLEDAAFRGPLVRAVVRGVEIRADESRASELWATTGPMLERILLDAEERVPGVLRLAQASETIDGDLLEQINSYIMQIGDAARVYWLLGKRAGEGPRVARTLEQLLQRLSTMPKPSAACRGAYQDALDNLLVGVALELPLAEPEVDWDVSGQDPDEVAKRGVERLRTEFGDTSIDWERLQEQRR